MNFFFLRKSFSTSLKPKFFIFFLVFIATFCHSGCEDGEPGEMVAKAMLCFNNKYIYDGCNEAYRLNESGELNVPRDETDVFCRGPCLVETQMVLNCIDNIFSSFLFNNKVNVGGLRYALNQGCSFSNQRGNFNLGGYLQGEASIGWRPQMNISFICVCISMLLFLYLGPYLARG